MLDIVSPPTQAQTDFLAFFPKVSPENIDMNTTTNQIKPSAVPPACETVEDLNAFLTSSAFLEGPLFSAAEQQHNEQPPFDLSAFLGNLQQQQQEQSSAFAASLQLPGDQMLDSPLGAQSVISSYDGSPATGFLGGASEAMSLSSSPFIASLSAFSSDASAQVPASAALFPDTSVDDAMCVSPLQLELSYSPHIGGASTTAKPLPPTRTASQESFVFDCQPKSDMAISQAQSLTAQEEEEDHKPLISLEASPAPTCASSTTSNKRKYTGTRNTKIPPVALDAPTLPKSYVTPSATSRKRAPPAVTGQLTKRRKSSSASSAKSATPGDGPEDTKNLPTEDDNIPDELLSAIELKRRQNTIAARRSRARKQQHIQELSDQVAVLEQQLAESQRAFAELAQRATQAGLAL